MSNAIRNARAAIGIALASLTLAGCVGDGYNDRTGSTWASPAYNGWYDGYYGSIYDGYWGSNNSFYYRQSERDQYRRGDRRHFQRGEIAPNPRFQRFEGQTRQPQQGVRMPQYPRQNAQPGHQNGPRDHGANGQHPRGGRDNHQ